MAQNDAASAVVHRILYGEHIHVEETLIFGAPVDKLIQGIELGIWTMQTAIRRTLIGEDAATPGSLGHVSALTMQQDYQRFAIPQPAIHQYVTTLTEAQLYSLFCVVWNHIASNTMTVGGSGQRVVTNT